MRVADAPDDGPDVDGATVDVPAFLMVVLRAAGEAGHVPMISADVTDREAATAWGRERPCAHDQPVEHGRDRSRCGVHDCHAR